MCYRLMQREMRRMFGQPRTLHSFSYILVLLDMWWNEWTCITTCVFFYGLDDELALYFWWWILMMNCMIILMMNCIWFILLIWMMDAWFFGWWIAWSSFDDELHDTVDLMNLNSQYNLLNLMNLHDRSVEWWTCMIEVS